MGVFTSQNLVFGQNFTKNALRVKKSRRKVVDPSLFLFPLSIIRLIMLSMNCIGRATKSGTFRVLKPNLLLNISYAKRGSRGGGEGISMLFLRPFLRTSNHKILVRPFCFFPQFFSHLPRLICRLRFNHHSLPANPVSYTHLTLPTIYSV